MELNMPLFETAQEWSEQFLCQGFTYAEQMYMLEKSGLQVFNHKEMNLHLKYIGIKTFMPYLHYFWRKDDDGLYFKYISWGDVYRLYQFNDELRILILHVMGKIEIAFRAQITYQMEQPSGCLWQNRKELFKSPEGKILKDGRQVVQCVYTEIQDFMKKYFTLAEPRPFQDVMDKMTFGLLYRIYSHLKGYREKEIIARELGIPPVCAFSSSMYALEELRNCCAHPQWIWNRRFRVVPDPFFRVSENTWLVNYSNVKREKTFYRFCLLNYFMQIIDPEFNFNQRLRTLLEQYKDVISLSEMGFLEEWEQEEMWKSL